MSTLQARVKSVLSGDTLILTSVNNPRQERTLSLAFVSAPRLRREGDEPYAFASRDFLRRLLVGKVIHFRTLYKIPTTGREYGILLVGGAPGQPGANLPDLAVEEGWVKLRDDAGRKEEAEETMQLLEKLRALEARARVDGKGVWAEGKDGRVDCGYDVSDVKAFVDEWKGKNIEAIVEKVITGDRLIARLMTGPTNHTQTLLLLAGVRAPSTKRTLPDGTEQAGEPFAEEAQQFIEARLLQRNVTVTILGSSPQNQLVATVKHPAKGNIAPFLLEGGLARCTDHHSTLLGPEMSTLRAAEKKAKDARVGVYKGHVAAARPGQSEQDVVVSRVFNADTLFLRNKAGAEKRVSLSSVRQPKPSDPKQAPWGAEAKEWLRKRAIGKHVRVTIDGKRAATEGYEEREVATVTIQGKNVGLMLVENGMASVIRHRQDDQDRSPIYDELLQAEQKAQEEKKGMWADKGPATKAYVDYSESLEKAKRAMGLLSRQKKVPAIVDFVKSGSRFTVLIPRENAKLTLVISGIRAPRTARNPSEKSEPYGTEAADFANRRCLQRDVEIDVEDTDKVGGFIGTMYVNRENFAKLLLEEGFASVHAYSAEKTGNASELFAAEKKAKDARKGIWTDWDPSQDEDGDGADGYNDTNGAATNGDSATPRSNDWREVMVTHIDPATARIKVQTIGTSTTGKLTELMSAFRSLHIGASSNAQSLSGPPKTGEYVAAKFSEDGEWYRARVRRNDREKKTAEVLYIDYGNTEMRPWSELRVLSERYHPAKEGLKAQATDVALTLCQFPPQGEYLNDAIGFLQNALEGRKLKARVDAQEKDGLLWVSLMDSQSDSYDKSVNADAVADGYALVPRKLKAWERSDGEALKAMKKLEEDARDGKRGMWEYGDPTAADD
ncbi:nuclease domain-containing protein 1 [Rhizodiscina lignyota]|uniref:Probable endonuclease LCL3 n=1 Tax=Rhizodiscina lignyota TaxID=1504668 RepID=A0A9P4ME57_9PEZI|nr:nuclease domain-containing protein 1 [Rhizodiscina lignyota]